MLAFLQRPARAKSGNPCSRYAFLVIDNRVEALETSWWRQLWVYFGHVAVFTIWFQNRKILFTWEIEKEIISSLKPYVLCNILIVIAQSQIHKSIIHLRKEGLRWFRKKCPRKQNSSIELADLHLHSKKWTMTASHNPNPHHFEKSVVSP